MRIYKYQDLTKQKIGKLLALELSSSKIDNNGTTKLWKCQCECGNILYKSARHLNEAKKNGKELNCGCLRTKDLTGKVFGDLTAIKSISIKGRKNWVCVCKCGEEVLKTVTYLEKNNYICKKDRYRNKKNKDEIFYIKRRLRGVHRNMKNRCADPNDKSYKNYGGRGITVCKEWQKFTNFFEWAIDNGYKQGLTIDRIDNNGNYCPENCRWADKYVQMNNKIDNILISYNGKSQSLRAWCRELQLPYRKTHKRYTMYGWNIERCFAEKERIGFK